MVDVQLTYDALRLLGFDAIALASPAGDMTFLRDLAWAGRVAR